MRTKLPVTYSQGDLENEWPAIEGASPDAEQIPPEIIWQRMEQWAGRFFVPRQIWAIVTGPGALSVWDGSPFPVNPWRRGNGEFSEYGWEPANDVDFKRAQDGILVPEGEWRFLVSVGYEGWPNRAQKYAAKLLANYVAGAVAAERGGAPVGATSYSFSLGGDIRESWSIRGGAAVSDAMVKSGAAEALRSYRVLKGGW